MARDKKSHSKLRQGEKQNLWPELPPQLIDLLARNSSLMKDVHSKGVTKSWRTQSRKCRSHSPTPPWVELAVDYGNDQSETHTFKIPFKVGCFWYWYYRDRPRPNVASGHHILGCSQGLLIAKRFLDSWDYTLLDPYPYFGGWNIPYWDVKVPFLSAALSAYPLTKQGRRSQKEKSVVIVLTGVSRPAFVYYRIWEGGQGWVKNDCETVDPHCCDPNRKDHFIRFGNGIWLKEKFYALSIQGTVAVIEDIGNDVRITAIGKRVVPSVASLHYRECLVELGGKVLAVFLVSKNSVNKVDCVEVYELNSDELSWNKKENLGGLTLFLGVHCCVGVSATRVGCRENCIYFSISISDGWWVYDMETCIFSSLGTAKFLDWIDS